MGAAFYHVALLLRSTTRSGHTVLRSWAMTSSDPGARRSGRWFRRRRAWPSVHGSFARQGQAHARTTEKHLLHCPMSPLISSLSTKPSPHLANIDKAEVLVTYYQQRLFPVREHASTRCVPGLSPSLVPCSPSMYRLLHFGPSKFSFESRGFEIGYLANAACPSRIMFPVAPCTVGARIEVNPIIPRVPW